MEVRKGKILHGLITSNNILSDTIYTVSDHSSAISSDWSIRAEERLELLLDFMAVGRGTEVGLTTWNSVYWSYIHNALGMNWMELKVSRQKMMLFVNDSRSYKFDVLFALFFYLASNRGISVASNNLQLIFPTLGRDNGRYAADDISKIIKKLVPYVDSLCEDQASKDLRYGPTNIIMLAKGGSSDLAAARGGWMSDDVTERKTGALVYYLTCLETHVVRAGHILAGREIIDKTYSNPRLVVSEEESIQIERFLFELFNLAKRHEMFIKDKDLKQMQRVCFATFLLWLDKVSLAYYFIL
jgi:hypothetical protein